MKKKSSLWVFIFALVAVNGYLLYYHIYRAYRFDKLRERILSSALSSFDETALAGQALHIAIPGTTLNEQNKRILARVKPGGIIFFGFNLENAEQTRRFTADLQNYVESLGLPPLLISTDQEGGYVKRVTDGVLQSPPPRDLGSVGDSGLCFSTGYYVSKGLAKQGINVFFAPIVDINNNPENPVIGLRSFGDTVDAVLRCALPFEQGARAAFREGGALPVIKHFPGHGDTRIDSHWALPVIDKSLAALQAFELVPFREAVERGTRAVMTAHILYPQVDRDAPATLSQTWLTNILRGTLQFKGLIFTDAMEMSAVSKHYGKLNPPVAALKAGADVLLYTSWQDEMLDAHQRIINEFSHPTQQNLQNPSALQRAVMNQLKAKLLYLKLEKYISPEDAAWYRAYQNEIEKDAPKLQVHYKEEALKEKLKTIRWSKPRARNQPQWLAGQKNAR
ncbi:MAG TPA: glycoside hydrolase family 3 protein [Turneriella sp.]|nr:glycoside hydrolase family 3 protein [Turneriella sp.]